MEKISYISDWGSRVVGFVYPAFPIILFVLVSIISKFKKDDISDVKNMDHRYRKISYKPDKYVLISVISLSAFVLFVLLVYIDSKCQKYIMGMINSIDTVCIISMTFTAMVFAMVFVLVLREKNYYLAFSLADVLEKYNFYFWVKALFISCILVSLLVVSLLDGDLSSEIAVIRFIALQEIFLFNLFCMLILFWIIAQIMFSSESRELKLLDRLYQFYMIPNVDVTHIQGNWNDENAIRMNLTYLYERYLNCGKRIDINNVQKIVYLSRMENEENPKETIKQTKRRYYFCVIIFLFVWICMRLATNLRSRVDMDMLIQIILFALDFIFPCLPFKFISKWLHNVFGYNAGYKFYGSKEQFVMEVTCMPWERKYAHYIQAMNSWFAFVSIALDKKTSPESINNVLNNYVRDMGETFKTSVNLLPFWVIGYMLFVLRDNKEEKSDADELDYLRKLYKGLKLKQEQKSDFQDMVRSQIAYMERKQKSYSSKRAGEYIDWLSKK